MNLDLSLFSSELNLKEELLKFVSDEINKDKILHAYDFAFKAHENQFRESGEPYISHPVWVAKIAAQLNLGEEAIITGLLHDCVEDTNTTIDSIANIFGDEVALLVDALTEVKKKTKGIEFHETSIDIFRRFLLSSVDDVRILILRLIDKLHNGLTIKSLSRERQLKYAKRVFGIYGPIAEYVGLHYFKKLLDDIAFEIMYPDELIKIKSLLESKGEIKAKVLVQNDIEQMLKINNINDFEIEGRIKSLYSTYLKIKRKGTEVVTDRIGLRILLNNISQCYTVLGLLHSRFRYLADEFDDYISSPKPSGYRSIQTTLIWKSGLTVEVQIRTFEMHEFNEFGPASHIAYKYGKESGKGGLEWVKDLVKWQINKDNVNNYSIKVLTNHVYVFTPKGDVIQLQKGATALDFAYRIHSEVGNYCMGVKINQKMAKINDQVNTGDIVEIVTSKKKNVCKNWLEFVKTSFARDQIKKNTLDKV